MEVIGSEIGQKMRIDNLKIQIPVKSAIKAKLTELGCYVDDELPDYVMVMVANKRTRAQMEEDLQLFLGDNTELFVNWLHQVLKKLQEVTVAPPSQVETLEKHHSSVKDKKDKKGKSKDKHKKSDTKKGKKKDKHRKRKDDKKSHKEKKKNKHQDAIRPNIPLNIPPLLMNIEKQSEPSITDVFAGQILKNHGVNIDSRLDDLKTVDTKPIINKAKKTHLPIIDLATISQSSVDVDSPSQNTEATNKSPDLKEDPINEINQIEAKIEGLKQKLVDQLDSMSEDDDFINIRTEAEELMNDFADDVIQEISAANTESTETPALPKSKDLPVVSNKTIPPTSQIAEVLPQIELQLPKRPLRNRLGPREELKKVTQPPKESSESPERFTPDREPVEKPHNKVSAKSRLGHFTGNHKRRTDIVDKPESSSGRTAFKVGFLESRVTRSGPASVVRVRPRMRPATQTPASNLLFRAVADANKSLINAPPKPDAEKSTVKRAFVMPMRREMETQKIIIQVPGNSVASSPGDMSDCEIDCDTESLPDLESDTDNKSNKTTTEQSEYMPISITRRFINNTNYVPTNSNEHSHEQDDVFLDPITIHNAKSSQDKDKGPQFVVTLDGLDPNVFLAKKLRTEGLIDEDEELKLNTARHKKPLPQKPLENDQMETVTENADSNECEKRPSETSDEREITVTINIEKDDNTQNECEEKRPSDVDDKIEGSQVRKRKASPIVFDVEKKGKPIEKEVVRQRTESASSEGQVSVSTTPSKYDTVPSLSVQEKKLQPCRSFPACRWGAACVFQHPPCKFAAACSRRSCVYSHPTTACSKTVASVTSVASHVVPAPNYKSITTVVLPGMCKFYPNCGNPGCHFFHPKTCRYGKACLNKLECNFYHHDVQSNSSLKWRSANV